MRSVYIIAAIFGLLNVTDARGCKHSREYKEARAARQEKKISRMCDIQIKIIQKHAESVDKYSVSPGTMSPIPITFSEVRDIVSKECYPPILHKPIYPESEMCDLYSEWLGLKFSW